MSFEFTDAKKGRNNGKLDSRDWVRLFLGTVYVSFYRRKKTRRQPSQDFDQHSRSWHGGWRHRWFWEAGILRSDRIYYGSLCLNQLLLELVDKTKSTRTTEVESRLTPATPR